MRKPKKPTGKDIERAYDVGHSKPPKRTRFRRGQSGNPKGRPKAVRNFRTDLRDTLEAPVRVTRDGRPHKVSTQEAMLLRLREKALNGDARALDRFIALAQTNSNDEQNSAVSLSLGDSAILEIFRARVLSGAAATSAPTEGEIGARESDLPSNSSHWVDAASKREPD